MQKEQKNIIYKKKGKKLWINKKIFFFFWEIMKMISQGVFILIFSIFLTLPQLTWVNFLPLWSCEKIYVQKISLRLLPSFFFILRITSSWLWNLPDILFFTIWHCWFFFLPSFFLCCLCLAFFCFSVSKLNWMGKEKEEEEEITVRHNDEIYLLNFFILQSFYLHVQTKRSEGKFVNVQET